MHIEKNNNSPKLIDEEWNWRYDNYDKEIAWKYKYKGDVWAEKNLKRIFSGDYLGYWGAPDKKSLEKAKKIMGFKELK
jgi:hypothetical protein